MYTLTQICPRLRLNWRTKEELREGTDLRVMGYVGGLVAIMYLLELTTRLLLQQLSSHRRPLVRLSVPLLHSFYLLQVVQFQLFLLVEPDLTLLTVTRVDR